MQTAGVKIGENLKKRLTTSGGRTDPPTGVLCLYVQDLNFMETKRFVVSGKIQ